VDTAETKAERVVACLERLDEVQRVAPAPEESSICRELALLKVPKAAQSPAIRAVAGAPHTPVLADDAGGLVLEVVGAPEEIDRIVGSVADVDGVEVVRVGPVAIAR